MITTEFVRNVFAPFEQGKGVTFFENHAAEYVDFAIMGHDPPTAGHYNSRAEAISVMNRIVNCPNPHIKRKVTNVLVSGNWAVEQQVKQA